MIKTLIYASCLGTAVILLSSFGCNSQKKTADVKKTENMNDQPAAIEVIKQDGFTAPENSASFTVNSHSLKGDVLTLNISYSGGCAKHLFSGYFNGMFMKSMPPKANLIIVHENNGDTCRELKTEDISFNVKAMRYGTKGPMKILIAGYTGVIDYTY